MYEGPIGEIKDESHILESVIIETESNKTYILNKADDFEGQYEKTVDKDGTITIDVPGDLYHIIQDMMKHKGIVKDCINPADSMHGQAIDLIGTILLSNLSHFRATFGRHDLTGGIITATIEPHDSKNVCLNFTAHPQQHTMTLDYTDVHPIGILEMSDYIAQTEIQEMLSSFMNTFVLSHHGRVIDQSEMISSGKDLFMFKFSTTHRL